MGFRDACIILPVLCLVFLLGAGQAAPLGSVAPDANDQTIMDILHEVQAELIAQGGSPDLLLLRYGNETCDFVYPPTATTSYQPIGLLWQLSDEKGVPYAWGKLFVQGLVSAVIAIDYYNDQIQPSSGTLPLAICIKDVSTSVTKVIAAVKVMHSHGITWFVGPTNNQQLEAVQQDPSLPLDQLNFVNPYVSTPRLSYDGQAKVFSIPKAADAEAAALALAMQRDETRCLASLVLNDTFVSIPMSILIQSSYLSIHFPPLPGESGYGKGVLSNPASVIISQRGALTLPYLYRVLDELMNVMRNTECPSGRWGVLLVSTESMAVLNAAQQYAPELAKIKWYGTDSSVYLYFEQAPTTAAMEFAIASQFEAAVYIGAGPEAVRATQILDILLDAAPFLQRQDSLSMWLLMPWDALRLVSGMMSSNQNRTLPAQNADGSFYFGFNANSSIEATGWLEMDQSGQRSAGDVATYVVRETQVPIGQQRQYQWTENSRIRYNGASVPPYIYNNQPVPYQYLLYNAHNRTLCGSYNNKTFTLAPKQIFHDTDFQHPFLSATYQLNIYACDHGAHRRDDSGINGRKAYSVQYSSSQSGPKTLIIQDVTAAEIAAELLAKNQTYRAQRDIRASVGSACEDSHPATAQQASREQKVRGIEKRWNQPLAPILETTSPVIQPGHTIATSIRTAMKKTSTGRTVEDPENFHLVLEDILPLNLRQLPNPNPNPSQ